MNLLPGHVEGGPPCPGADVEDLHAWLEVDELEELPGGGLAAHTHPGLAEYLLVPGDAIPEWIQSVDISIISIIYVRITYFEY